MIASNLLSERLPEVLVIATVLGGAAIVAGAAIALLMMLTHFP
jgi:hypothetical protein